MGQSTQCIYCSSAGPFSNEHAIPRCLGEFQGFPVLTDRICRSCNNQIGQVEEQFCRSGPEAFFRTLLGIGGRPTHELVNPFERGSAGAKPIDFVALHPELGIPILWEFNRGERSVREVRQIVVKDEHAASRPLRIPEWMTEPEQLRQAIADLGLGQIREVRGFASPDEAAWVENLVQGLGGRFEWLPSHQSVTITNPIATFTVTGAYFRAVAKCGFHYFLAVVSNVLGSEEPFAALRKFIISGDDTDQFIIQDRTPLIAYPAPGYRPSWYGHVIVAEWQNGSVKARAQFFLGPDYEPPTYRIRIGEGINILEGIGRKGHLFAYFRDGQRGRYHGEVSEWIGC